MEIKSVNGAAVRYIDNALTNEINRFYEIRGYEVIDQVKALVLMSINGYTQNEQLLKTLCDSYIAIPEYAHLVNLVLDYLNNEYASYIIALKNGKHVDGESFFSLIKSLLKKHIFSYNHYKYLD